MRKEISSDSKIIKRSLRNTLSRPVTTLFMLMSVDGKISTGSDDKLDFDRDLPRIAGTSSGLHQYYDIEKTTDLWSLNSGRVQAKIGINSKIANGKTPVSFVMIDNYHLLESGVRYFCEYSKQIVIVTTNPNHPAFNINADNLYIILQNRLNLSAMLSEIYQKFGCERITLQSGGTLNSIFLREKLIDYLNIIVAPLLVGGSDVSTLIDGKSITTLSQLNELGVLKLQKAKVLSNSYIQLIYKVIG